MDGLDCELNREGKAWGEESGGLHDEVTVALEVGVDALETDNRAVRRLQGERLVGPKLDFFVDAALERAHG